MKTIIPIVLFCFFSCTAVKSQRANEFQKISEFPFQDGSSVILQTNFVDSNQISTFSVLLISNKISKATVAVTNFEVSGILHKSLKFDILSNRSIYLFEYLGLGSDVGHSVIFSVATNNLKIEFNQRYSFYSFIDLDNDKVVEFIGSDTPGGQVFYNYPEMIVWKLNGTEFNASKSLTFSNIILNELPDRLARYKANPRWETLFGVCANYVFLEEEEKAYKEISNFFSTNSEKIPSFILLLNEARSRKAI